MADLEERTLGPSGAVTVYFGNRSGGYPEGNSVVVRGADTALVVDPSLGLLPGLRPPPEADFVVNTHCHEDHIAGNHLYAELPWYLHEADAPGVLGLDHMMAIFGLPAELDARYRPVILEKFHYRPRPDPIAYRDGHVFDLGGGVRVHVIHAPGHTRGHCLLWIEPDDILHTGDIDLSSFGPYYGDAWSDLIETERSLGRVRRLDPKVWVTFHHVGVLEDRETFDARLDRFEAKIGEREQRLLEFLSGTPRSLDEIVAHRFIFRPQDDVLYADGVERRSMGLHLERLLAAGRVAEVEPGRFLYRPTVSERVGDPGSRPPSRRNA